MPTKTKPVKVPINRPTGKAPIRGKLARISQFHATRGKTMVKATTPKRSSY